MRSGLNRRTPLDSKFAAPTTRRPRKDEMLNSSFATWTARVVLLIFGGWTTVVVLDHGYTGFLTLAAEHHWGAQMFVDLAIALALFAVWMVDDARSRGRTVWPFLVLTLFTGSIGPLLYLSLRGTTDAANEASGT
jgi:hypothetical protein